MSENKEQEPKKVLSLSGRPKLELKRGPDATSQVRQSFSHGRSKAVTVEVKTQRVARAPLTLNPAAEPVASRSRSGRRARPDAAPRSAPALQPRQLTAEEREVRIRALKTAAQDDRRHPEPELTSPEPQPKARKPTPAPRRSRPSRPAPRWTPKRAVSVSWKSCAA